MRLTVLAAAVAVLLATSSLVHAQQQQFQIFASIADGSGAPVSALQPGDLRIVENGAEANIVKAEPVSWPMKIQVMVDNGVGLGSENLLHLRNGLKGLFEALPADVEVTLYTTAPQARTVVKPTTDKATLQDGISRIAPDGGTGRFIESLNEAAQRIEKDKTDHFPVIILVGTTAGDGNFLERDVQKMMQRLSQRPSTVHVVMLSNTKSTTGGANQTNVGIAVTQMTGGRFESIAAPSRLATLLPEIGQQVAKSHDKQSHQFRITAQRPGGASGELGNLGISVRSPLQALGISRDGHMP
jgi:hypothetical protein